jgi:hypothetical protein
MTAEYPQGDKPLIPMPELSLPALRQAVAVVKPSRLPSPSSGGPRPSLGSTPPNEPSPTPTRMSGIRQFGKSPRSSRRLTARPRVFLAKP